MKRTILAGLGAVAVAACGQSERGAKEAASEPAAAVVAEEGNAAPPAVTGNPDRDVYFGAVHVHTQTMMMGHLRHTGCVPDRKRCSVAQVVCVLEAQQTSPREMNVVRTNRPLDICQTERAIRLIGKRPR